MLLVEHNQVVGALAAQRPDNSFDNGVCLWRVNRRRDAVDTDAPSTLAKVPPIRGVSIAQQMPWRVSPGVASISCRQIQAAVGLAVTLTCTSSRRPFVTHGARLGSQARRRA